jgi:hypothetical protein
MTPELELAEKIRRRVFEIEMSNTEMVLVMDQRAAAAAAVDEVLRAVREDRGVE